MNCFNSTPALVPRCVYSRSAFLTVLSLSIVAGGRSLNADEDTRSTLSLEQIASMAASIPNQIQSGRVSLHYEFDEIRKVPSFEQEKVSLALAPFYVDFAFMDDWRRSRRTPDRKNSSAEEMLKAGISPYAQTTIFDGSISLSMASEGIARISKHKSDHCEVGSEYFYELLGIPLTDEQIAGYDNSFAYPHCLRDEPTAQAQYRVLNECEVVDGALCHVVVADGFDKLWVDPNLNCAFRKRERYYGPETPCLIARDEVGSFVEVRPGIWAATEWTQTLFVPPSNPRELWDQPYLRKRIRVTKIMVNDVRKEEFAVKLGAGTYVFDIDNSKTYTVPGGDEAVLTDFTRIGRELITNPRASGNAFARPQFSWFIVVNLLIIAGLLIAVVVARFRPKDARR